MSIYSGIYNVGTGDGGLIGGLVCTHIGIGSLCYIGGAIAVLATAFCLLKCVPVYDMMRRRG